MPKIFYILFALALVFSFGCGILSTLGFVACNQAKQKKKHAVLGLHAPLTGRFIDKDADLDDVWIKRDPEDGLLKVYTLTTQEVKRKRDSFANGVHAQA